MTVALGPSVVRDFTAMGTSCRVILAREDAAALERAERWVERTAARLTRFDEDSELCRLNRAAGHWIPISPLLEQLLRTALWAHERSGGLVHAGVLPSLLGLGYRRPFRERRLLPIPAVPPAPPPPLPVMLTLRRGAARLRRGTAIDLGGIAKGWMADRLAARLDQPSVVNLGGDLFASAGDSA
ncbi:MAG: FAD:protein FMN transferase, partial [Candidatus Dormiibacterota bacterium]